MPDYDNDDANEEQVIYVDTSSNQRLDSPEQATSGARILRGDEAQQWLDENEPKSAARPATKERKTVTADKAAAGSPAPAGGDESAGADGEGGAAGQAGGGAASPSEGIEV